MENFRNYNQSLYPNSYPFNNATNNLSLLFKVIQNNKIQNPRHNPKTGIYNN